jgi:hypothetical protein
MTRKVLSRKRVLICNTGRCKGRVNVTPELRQKVAISGGGVHTLSADDAGHCPRCGSDAGFVDRNAAAFASDLNRMFRL